MRRGQLWVDGERPARLLLRGRGSPQAGEHQRVRRVCVRPLRGGGAQLLELPARVVEFPQPQQQLGHEQAGVRVPGIHGERRACFDQRVGLRVAMNERGGQVEVGLREIFVERERGAEALLRARPVAATNGHQAQAIFGFPEPRLELEREREVARRPIQLAAPQRVDA